MLTFLRRGQRWVTVAIVIGIGGVFVFYMGWGAPQNSGPRGSVIAVGPYHFGAQDFERARAERKSSRGQLHLRRR